jgi:hypothetical protein
MADSDNEGRPAEDFLSLLDAAAALSGQLWEAASASTVGPQFKVAEIEMEFSIEAIAGTDGQVKFGVACGSASGKPSNLTGHRAKIKLVPTEEKGQPLRISRSWDEGDLP